MNKEFNEKFIGDTLDVLFEEESKFKVNHIEGYTTNYIRVITVANETLIGEISSVKIESVHGDSLIGIINN